MAAETRKPQTYQKAPGAPTKAQQLARLTEQMLDLARETEALCEGMLPAQVEYALRLCWDHLDDDHRALHIAFVDRQVRERGKAAS